MVELYMIEFLSEKCPLSVDEWCWFGIMLACWSRSAYLTYIRFG